MLKIRDLKKKYPGFCLDCSLDVRPGMITGLVGPNGAGKTTLYKAALGLIRPDAGSVEIFGKDSFSLSPEERKRIGVVLSESGFCGYLRVGDTAKILEAFYPAFNKKRYLESCRQFGLELTKQIKDMSTGMKARLKLLTALSHGADLLILDEPTAGLDVLARDELLVMLREYMEEKEDRAVLISSHLSSDLEGLCDDLVFIDRGRVILREDTDAILSDYCVLKMSEEDLQLLDRSHVLKIVRGKYGCRVLTDQKRFYLENYPEIAAENGSIDDLVTMLVKGESI